MKPVKDILKHSSVYAVGQILSRFASILLLPLYTRCLSPADYGCVAILDLTAGILAILIGSGMASAVVRSYFDTEDEDARSKVWWTGLTWVSLSATVLVLPLIIARQSIADLTLGSNIMNGGMFYLLATGTLWMNTVSELLETWLRVKKRSGTFVALSTFRLLLNIVLNVWFLVGLDLGIGGLLTGNVIAATANTTLLLLLFARSQSAFAFDKAVLRTLLSFGSPLIIQAFLSLMMHEADRYILRAYASLDQVGVYSLAYKVGQAVNTLCLIPFAAIWSVVLYEIAQQPDAKNTFAQVFKYYVYGLLVVMLAAALFAFPVLPLLTPGDFSQAVDLIPVIVLAFIFFAMHSQFSVPVLLARRTAALIPASVVGVIANVVCNCLFVDSSLRRSRSGLGERRHIRSVLVHRAVVLSKSRSISVPVRSVSAHRRGRWRDLCRSSIFHFPGSYRDYRASGRRHAGIRLLDHRAVWSRRVAVVARCRSEGRLPISSFCIAIRKRTHSNTRHCSS